jgi:hypothetical protein
MVRLTKRNKKSFVTVGVAPETKARLELIKLAPEQSHDEVINLLLNGKLQELIDLKKKVMQFKGADVKEFEKRLSESMICGDGVLDLGRQFAGMEG